MGGLGPKGSKKKQMIKDGILNKYGKPNEKTPPNWNASIDDFSVNPAGAASLVKTEPKAEPVEGSTETPKKKRKREAESSGDEVNGISEPVTPAGDADGEKKKKKKKK